jgi:hypothetical protein
MTNSIQEWLGIRVDFFGNLLVFGIALFACGFRTTVSPSKIGVVLSYTLSSKLHKRFFLVIYSKIMSLHSSHTNLLPVRQITPLFVEYMLK